MYSENPPDLFKGIALFTPGGGLVYCIDPNKQERWHLHLCAALRDILGLEEPPHFLVPCYTATIDRWLDPQTGQVQTVAEAAPFVLKHQALLNAVFGVDDLVWQATPFQESLCDPMVLATYRKQFPQLWDMHDLVVRYGQPRPASLCQQETESQMAALAGNTDTRGCVLRLFVAGPSAATERTLLNLHQLLEQALGQPYTLKVIDVTQHPEQAELDQVAATPTLVRVWPHPVRRLVGSLDQVEQLLWLLGVGEASDYSAAV